MGAGASLSPNIPTSLKDEVEQALSVAMQAAEEQLAGQADVEVPAILRCLAADLLRQANSKDPQVKQPKLELRANQVELYTSMLRQVELLKGLGDSEIASAIQALETQTFKAGEVIYRQDEQGDDCFFVVAGECYATSRLYGLGEGTRVAHKKHGEGVVAEVTTNPSITKVVFDKGESHRYTPPSLHKLKPVEAVEPRVVEVMQYTPERNNFFGERALSRVEPRAKTITCRTDVTVLRLTAATFLRLQRQQEHKENLLRGVSLFETFGDDQIATLASILQPREFQDRATLVQQGEVGHSLFILDVGECVASIQNGSDVQVVKRYAPGELFGEKALLESTVRAATITAVGDGVKVWMVSREAFEAQLGPLSQLKAEQYLTDPRALIAAFYGKGDTRGPSGVVAKASAPPPPAAPAQETAWFAVYRPCSRDSIAKMLGRVGTGKGLNIKGKSAKKNRLSGFVPFMQISKNEDKAAVEAPSREARVRIFYQSASARDQARAALESALAELQVERGKKLPIERPEVSPIAEYEDSGAYGLDVPEALLHEAYIVRPDVSPVVGWETGRESEPAFLNMNLHALRDGSEPPVVLYQFDKEDAMNPAGLLMAYAEARVVPVVSDFDTFTVGSRGMRYEPTPPEQVELMNWALDHTSKLLGSPDAMGWMARWLAIIAQEARNGFHPKLPKYGFGDPTSYGLIGDIVEAMSACGAVRHGAECFNFYFPQELDEEFLIVWDGLDSPPWKTVTEPELRAFLLERAKEGFSFPLNPVWPIRDPGWFEVLQALRAQPEAAANLESWFPPESGVLQRIEDIHGQHGEGFRIVVVACSEEAQRADKLVRHGSVWKAMTDCDTRDMGHLGALEVAQEVKIRWRRVRCNLKELLLKGA